VLPSSEEHYVRQERSGGREGGKEGGREGGREREREREKEFLASVSISFW